MTRRDFELIARIVRENVVYGDTPLADLIRARTARAFADVLPSTNPNFNRARFLKACGVED